MLRSLWKSTFLKALVIVTVPLGLAVPALADDIKAAVASALKDGFSEIVREFENQSGHKVVVTFAGTAPITKMLSDGQVFDVVIIAGENNEQLAKAGKLVPGPHPGFARSGVGLAIRAGLPAIDVSTPEAVRQALLGAASIAYSAGPSGVHAASVLQTLGVSDQIASRVKQYPSGVETANGLKRGEIDLAFALTSEFKDAAGITDLGPLPAELQKYTTYTIGMHLSAPSEKAARMLVEKLVAPDARPKIIKMGMEPG